MNDDEAARLLATSRALVVTTGEEFGIAAVEAQAAGRPVIARAAGGLLENVVDGVTGCLWEGGPEELAEAVVGFDTARVDPAACIANARRFDAVGVPRELPARGAGRAARGPVRAARDLAARAAPPGGEPAPRLAGRPLRPPP